MLTRSTLPSAADVEDVVHGAPPPSTRQPLNTMSWYSG